jgi:hypothetical protein
MILATMTSWKALSAMDLLAIDHIITGDDYDSEDDEYLLKHRTNEYGFPFCSRRKVRLFLASLTKTAGRRP